MAVAVAVAVAMASSYSSDSTPSLGTSICIRCGPKNTRKKKKKVGRKEGEEPLFYFQIKLNSPKLKYKLNFVGFSKHTCRMEVVIMIIFS